VAISGSKQFGSKVGRESVRASPYQVQLRTDLDPTGGPVSRAHMPNDVVTGAPAYHDGFRMYVCETRKISYRDYTSCSGEDDP
jgi:hypothetical protein